MSSVSDYAPLRHAMVQEQLVKRGIRSEIVLDAMSALPRHKFVPENQMSRAYEDCALPIGFDVTISQPYMVACMSEWLHCGPDDKVLEIGTGSGYQAALLASMVKEVYTVERISELSRRAKISSAELGIKNIHFKVDDGTVGWPEFASYDAILVTAGAPDIPSSLLHQLAIKGRLVCPVGDRKKQILVQITRTQDTYLREEGTICRFVPLIGKEGWSL